jgi:predicted anti-sigma-YlaC factor YlaD
MPFDPCHKPRTHFSDHLDGEPLPFFTGFVVRMHLTICPACRRLNRSLVATQAALRALQDADLPAELPDTDLPDSE